MLWTIRYLDHIAFVVAVGRVGVLEHLRTKHQNDVITTIKLWVAVSVPLGCGLLMLPPLPLEMTLLILLTRSTFFSVLDMSSYGVSI